jgi:hypothetical protein
MAQDTIRKALENKGTPQPILSAILFWINTLQLPELSNSQPSRGSVVPANMLLSQCITHQSTLGLNNFIRGRLSNKWSLYEYYVGAKAKIPYLTWAKYLIIPNYEHTLIHFGK